MGITELQSVAAAWKSPALTIVGRGVCQCCAGKAPESVWQSAELLKGEMQESQLEAELEVH